MKKLLAIMLTLGLVFACTACGNGGGGTASTASTASEKHTNSIEVNFDGKIALITDVGNIDDKSFNQGAWEGVKEFGDAYNVSYDYFRPAEDSTVARVNEIKNAIGKGYNVIVCPGYLFEEAIYEVQDGNPEVTFILLDGEPHNADYSEYKTAENTTNILYQEEQAGYLAGYAAVKDGYTKLGFLGGMEVPAVQRYGYGYVQGINAAAKEMGNVADIEVKYWYCGGFSPNDDIQTKMASWYTEGTEVVFSCGGGIYLSATAAATAANAKVIGVDVDQHDESPDTIISSAMKGLTSSVVLTLESLYSNGGKLPADKAGKTSTLGAADNGVGLPTADASWGFTTFTVDEYNALFEGLKDGSVVVSNDISAHPAVEIAVDYQS